MKALDLVRAGAAQGCRPHERYLLDASGWAALAAALREDAGPALLALWAEPATVHAAFAEGGALLLASGTVPGGHYAALSPARPGAVPFERAVHDLWGLVADGAVDARPWLDHGRWPMTAPLSARPVRSGLAPEPDFLPAEGEGAHLLPLGPVQGVAEPPAQHRLHVVGERVVRLEVRLGYAHKGVLGLMQGRSPRAAARYAARLAAGATVAHAWAFAMAAEAACGTEPPPRAVLLRAVMAELERVRCHLDAWDRLCVAAGAPALRAPASRLRETVMQACGTAFGHRLLLDRVVPGGVAADLAEAGAAALCAAVAAVADCLPALAAAEARLADRLAGVGPVAPDLARRYAAGGPVGRASGRRGDARLRPSYAPYDALEVMVPVLTAGDTAARARLRLAELRESLRLLPLLLDRLAPGPVLATLPHRAGEGVGVVEGPDGACLTWLALDADGLIRAVFPRDPAWAHPPLLEAAMAGGVVDDLAPACASFGGGTSGAEL